jgi:hypothetical protein
MVSGEVTLPVPKALQVAPLSSDHSYAVIAEPPLLPAVNDSCSELIVASWELIVGALAVIAKISNDLMTSVAARWFVASAADALMLQVPMSFIVIDSPLVVQVLVVSLTMVTAASDVVVGATSKGIAE